MRHRTPAFWQADGLPARLLAPAAALYGLAAARRQRAGAPLRPGCPVICVGNLVAGGAGKTPVALSLLARLQARGRQPHVLLRGYGGREAGPLRVDPARHDAAAVGDEALLFARHAPTWIARDRRAGAKAAEAAGAGLLLLDDGFQNPTLAKDLSLLVIDGAYGLGNGRLLPAGPLREPPAAAFARAQAIVVLGKANPALALPRDRPRLEAALRPLPGHDLAGRRVLAFAGIGRPAKFFATLRALGAEVVAERAFADHHPYRAGEVARLLAEAERLDARPVTTEKDALRLPADLRARVAVLAVEVVWQAPAALDALIDKARGNG